MIYSCHVWLVKLGFETFKGVRTHKTKRKNKISTPHNYKRTLDLDLTEHHDRATNMDSPWCFSLFYSLYPLKKLTTVFVIAFTSTSFKIHGEPLLVVSAQSKKLFLFSMLMLSLQSKLHFSPIISNFVVTTEIIKKKPWRRLMW